MLECVGILLVIGACALFVKYQPRILENQMLCGMMAVMGLVALLAGQGNGLFTAVQVGLGVAMAVWCAESMPAACAGKGGCGPCTARRWGPGRSNALADRLTELLAGRILDGKSCGPKGPLGRVVGVVGLRICSHVVCRRPAVVLPVWEDE